MFWLIVIAAVESSLSGSLLPFAMGRRISIVPFLAFRCYFLPSSGRYCVGRVALDVYFCLIGVGLLVFGYGMYELLISEIDVYRDQSDSPDGGGLLDICSLD